MFDLSDKVVIVTGGSGNVGGATVRAFAGAGARVVVPDRKEKRVEALFPDLAADERHFLIGETAVSDPDYMASLVEAVMEKYGRLDILVNTVGGYRAGSLPHETPLPTWEAMLNLNARVAFVTCSAVVESMVVGGYGRIVNVGGRSALKAGSKDIAYSASKSALARVTESFAAAYKSKGITANAVLPGTIDTPQNQAAMPNANFGKWVKPEAIAQVILFLASEAAGVINGTLIPLE